MTAEMDTRTRSTPSLGQLDYRTWAADVPPEWVSFGGVQGGLVMGNMAQAAALATGRTVSSISAHLLAPVAPGAVTFVAQVNKAGRSTSSVDVTVNQGGRVQAHAQVLAVADGSSTPAWTPAPPGHVVGQPTDFDVFALPIDFVPFAQFIEVRPTNGVIPGGSGADPVFEAWITRTTDEPLDQLAMAVLLDAMPPSLFAIWDAPRPLPTVEMSMHFSPAPLDSQWLMVRQETTWSSESYCVDDATLHTPDGVLVAQSRQIRKFLP